MSKARRSKPQRSSPPPLKTPPTPPPAETTSTAQPEVEPAPADAACVIAPEVAPSGTEQAHTTAPDFVASAVQEESAPASAAPAVTEALPASPPHPADAWSSVVPRFDAGTFGTTVVNYMIGEGNAFAAHMRALAGARSMGEVVRLQIGEFQRAADATLTCWGSLTVATGRTLSAR